MVNLPWVFPKAVNHITNERGIKVKTFVDVTLVFTKVISKLSWSQNFVVIRKKPNGTTKAFAECCHKFRWLNYLSLNWIGALTLSFLLKLPPRKWEPWFSLWSLFLLRLPCTFIHLPCSLPWNIAGASTSYLEILDKLQKRICRTVGATLATSPEPLAYHQNVLQIFRYYSTVSFLTQHGMHS